MALLDIEGELLRPLGRRDRPGRATPALTCDVCDADRGAAPRWRRSSGSSAGWMRSVTNAGIAVFAPLMETSDADWRRVLEVNLTGPFLCTKAAVPLMRDGTRRRHRQHHLDLGGARLDAALGLRHQQGRARASDQAARGRARLPQHPRQRGGAGTGRHRDGEAGAHRRRSAPTITTPFRSTATASRRNSRKLIFFLCSERCELHHRPTLAVDGGFDAAGIGLPTLRGQRRNG